MGSNKALRVVLLYFDTKGYIIGCLGESYTQIKLISMANLPFFTNVKAVRNCIQGQSSAPKATLISKWSNYILLH